MANLTSNQGNPKKNNGERYFQPLYWLKSKLDSISVSERGYEEMCSLYTDTGNKLYRQVQKTISLL